MTGKSTDAMLDSIASLIRQRDYAVELLARARLALDDIAEYATRTDYDLLASHLEDGPHDDAGNDLVAAKVEQLLTEQRTTNHEGDHTDGD